MARIKIQINKFRRRIKKASLSQLKEILVLLSRRLNKSRSLSSKKRIKAKIIITQMAIRGKMGNPALTTGLIGGPASWTNAAGPSVQGVTPAFASNILDGYNKFGCEFLCNRLLIQQNLLVGLSTAQTNSNWQTQLQNKIDHIQGLIQKYGCMCSDYRPRPFNCNAIKPYCKPLTNQTNGGNMVAVNATMTSISQQYGVSLTDVQAMFTKCCGDDTGRTRYSCYDDGTCHPDPNGQYATMADCQKNCGPRGDTRYSCYDDGNCYPDPNGQYMSLADCQKLCRPDRGDNRWMCEGGNCYPHPNGQFATQADCLKKCDPRGDIGCEDVQKWCRKYKLSLSGGIQPIQNSVVIDCANTLNISYTQAEALLKKCCDPRVGDGRYSCRDGNCYPDPNGQYMSLADCQKKCDPRGGGRWHCEGGTCFPHPSGAFASQADCLQKCGPRGGGKFDCIDGNCMPSPTGPYPTMAACQQKCDPRLGEGRFSCEGGNCYPDSSGIYTSMSDCQQKCGHTRFRCQNGNCFPDPTGPYASMADCQKKCDPRGGGRWLCEGGNCYPHPTGQFTSQADCLQKCGPRGGGRWKCVEGGNCIPHPTGPYTSQADCLKKCDPRGGNRFNCDKSGNCYPDANGPYATMAECQKKCEGGSSSRMKDCYNCDGKGGVLTMSRINWNQSCPKGWLSAPVINGNSKNPCGKKGTPTQGGLNNFSGIWFNDEY